MSQTAVHLELHSDNRRRLWRASAFWTAWVAAVFCATVAAVMIVRVVRQRPTEIMPAQQIQTLKDQLVLQPEDEAAKANLRQIDLDLRRTYLQETAFLKHGAYLLLGGALVLIVSVKTAATLGAGPYLPQAADSLQADARQHWMTAATTLALVGAAVAATFLTLAVAASHWIDKARP